VSWAKISLREEFFCALEDILDMGSLSDAVRQGDVGQVEALLGDGDLLQMAAESDRLDIMNVLLQRGFDPRHGEALTTACLLCNIPMVDAMLGYYRGGDAPVTTLLMAVLDRVPRETAGKLDMAKFLIEKGADHDTLCIL
jgi:hypothetical protein